MGVSRNDDDAELDVMSVQTGDNVVSMAERPDGSADVKVANGEDVAEGERLTVFTPDLRVLHKSECGEEVCSTASDRDS